MKLNTFKNKKGSVYDPILSSAYLVKIAATILICFLIWTSFQSNMLITLSGSSQLPLLTSVMDQLKTAYLSLDFVFPFLVGGLMIVSLIFAFKTGSNIVWGMLSFIVWGVTILLATVFQNVYLSISNEFPAIYSQYPIMDLIMTNLRTVVFFWIIAITAVMFRKNENEDTGGGRFFGK
jgi:hypothetical protein